MGSFRTEISPTNPIQRMVDVETSDQRKLQAADNLDKYHAETKSWRDKKILRKDINPGDMVLIRQSDKQGKLQSPWYGPYIVARRVSTGVFTLVTEDGSESAHTWNADNLRRFYP